MTLGKIIGDTIGVVGIVGFLYSHVGLTYHSVHTEKTETIKQYLKLKSKLHEINPTENDPNYLRYCANIRREMAKLNFNPDMRKEIDNYNEHFNKSRIYGLGDIAFLFPCLFGGVRFGWRWKDYKSGMEKRKNDKKA